MLELGTYYYTTSCSTCSKVSPLIQQLNDYLVGAHISETLAERRWESQRFEDRGRRGFAEEPERVKQTYAHGGIVGTPTVIWADGSKTTGGPREPFEGPVRTTEVREYLCHKAALVFLKTKVPAYRMDREERHAIARDLFEPDRGLSVRTDADGSRIRDPYRGLLELTSRYA